MFYTTNNFDLKMLASVIKRIKHQQDVFVKQLKCPRKWQIPKVANGTRTNILIPVGRSCHKKCSCNMKALIFII